MNDRSRQITHGLVLAFLMIVVGQPSSIFAQTCFGVVLSSQSQINDLAGTCTTLSGGLEIEEATAGDIVDLTPLRNIDMPILSSLGIYNNSMLTSLAGLEGIKTIFSSLTIDSNPSLKNVDGLEGMESMRGYLNIYNNASLENLNGFRNITQNPSGFNGLNIEGNPALTSLDGLEGLKTFDDLIYIAENATLMDIDGLQGLIGSSRSGFEIADNPMLMNVDGLQNLIEADYIEIFDNLMLADFCGLYPFFSSDTTFNSYYTAGNSANPTRQDIIAGGPCIPDPVELINELLANGNLTTGNANALLSMLGSCHLVPFNNLVNAFVNAGKITQTEADDLIAAAAATCASSAGNGNLLAPATPYLATIGQQPSKEETVNGVDTDFTLYPNPALDEVNVGLEAFLGKAVSLVVYNKLGQPVKVIRVDEIQTPVQQVQVGELPSGAYLMQVRTEAGVLSKAFLIIRD